MGPKTPISFDYENMLKRIETLVVSAQQNTKTRRPITQAALFLIWLAFLAIIEKRLEHRLQKEIFIFALVLCISF